MRKKPTIKKQTRSREYRTPKTIPWERAAEFYGNKGVSIGTSKVKEYVDLGRDK